MLDAFEREDGCAYLISQLESATMERISFSSFNGLKSLIS